jgi:predicted alpha/beta superfamily hydrolase
MHFRRASIALMTALLDASVIAQNPAAQNPGTSSPAAVTIARTYVHTLTSSVDGQEYKAFVSLPAGYSDASKRFPQLYLLDAQSDFTLVHGLLVGQVQDGYVPPILLVGVTWAGANPDYSQLRMKDFTPTKGRLPQTGNAPNFLKFIKQDLLPFIDSQYRTTPDRALVGHSLGGLFAVYTLFHEPALFNRYLIASPSLNYDSDVFTSYEKQHASRASRPPARIFMSIGELEGPKVAEFDDFARKLKARDYPEMKLETRTISDAGHSASQAAGYLEGLRALYAPQPVAVSPQILDQYIGAYRMAPGVTTQIVKDNDKLFFVAPEGTKYPLIAQSESDFVVRGLDLYVHFKRNADGEVTGLEGERSNGRHFNPRVP